MTASVKVLVYGEIRRPAHSVYFSSTISQGMVMHSALFLCYIISINVHILKSFSITEI